MTISVLARLGYAESFQALMEFLIPRYVTILPLSRISGGKVNAQFLERPTSLITVAPRARQRSRHIPCAVTAPQSYAACSGNAATAHGMCLLQSCVKPGLAPRG
jgi:hypothetical protein